MSNELLKQVAALEMPDIEQVRSKCMMELKKEKRVSYKWMVAVAASLLLVVCLFATPLGGYAADKIQQLFRGIHVNEIETTLGEVKVEEITIPANAQKYGEEFAKEYQEIYWKTYNHLEDLESDIGLDLKAWGKEADFLEDGISLNVVEDEYALIDLNYHDSKGEVMPAMMTVFIPLSEEVTLEDLEFDFKFSYEDEDVTYKDSTEEGNGEVVNYQEYYEIVEEYESKNLGTKVTAIEYCVVDEYEGEKREHIMYYMDYIYDGKIYEVFCSGTLEEAKEVIENMEK